MKIKIVCFRGYYRFLSNFSSSPITVDGLLYPTVEHAYQAKKSCNEFEKDLIRRASSPGNAKRLGRAVNLPWTWESTKVGIMLDLVTRKFAENPDLRKRLLDTGDAHLEEGNEYGDRFWGTCEGRGENMLGQILMAVRAALQ